MNVIVMQICHGLMFISELSGEYAFGGTYLSDISGKEIQTIIVQEVDSSALSVAKLDSRHSC